MWKKFLLLLVVIVHLFVIINCSENDSPTQEISTGTIQGSVVDQNGNSLSSARVNTQPFTSNVLTNSGGNYVISNVEAGTYVVMASKSGYTSNSATVNVSSGGTSTADIQLSSSGGASGFTFIGNYNGNLYYLSNNTAYWDPARQDCANNGGHLVTITSSGENSFLTNSTATGSIWIGLTDKNSEGNFVWITGETFSYSNWDTGQPDNANGNQHYGILQNNGRWDDGYIGNSYHYILEIE